MDNVIHKNITYLFGGEEKEEVGSTFSSYQVIHGTVIHGGNKKRSCALSY
jgi:hypothetical protein